jgi:hypothetical protein
MNEQVREQGFTTAEAPARAGRTRPARLVVGALLTAAVALAIDLIVYVLARAFDVSMTVHGQGGGAAQVVGVSSIIMITTASTAAAAVFAAVMFRFVRRARTIFPVVAGLLTLLSLSAPIGADVAATTRTVLIVMHLVTGGIIGYGIVRVAGGGPDVASARKS